MGKWKERLVKVSRPGAPNKDPDKSGVVIGARSLIVIPTQLDNGN